MESLRASSVLDSKKVGKKSKELWLFRVPADLDIKSLDGMQLPLETGEVRGTAKGKPCVFQVSSQEAAANEASQMLPLIPNAEGELRSSKPFSRLVKITKTFVVAEKYVVQQPEAPQQPAKLNGRVVPSGTGRKGIAIERRPGASKGGDRKKDKKEKKKKETEAAAAVEVKEEEVEEAKEEKKKRKKSSKDEEDKGEEEGAGEEKEKKKKKKKKKDGDEGETEVKEEPEDSDEEGKKSKRKSSEGTGEEEKKSKKKKKKDKSE